MFSSLPPVPALARRARRPLVGLVAVAAVASIGTATVPGLVTVADSDLPVSPGDRVLQAVTVEVAPDGAFTAVNGTTVISSADGSQADSTSQAYAPQDVVGDLPVRLRISYRTQDGSGSDLADLEGYTGRVQVDLTVENLTTEPEQLTYDVAGGSRTRPANVAAPMTITAAADLGRTDPASVVTQRAGEDAVTNGVLSQGPGGDTQVQWATILASPQLSPTATLSLVLDAKDFVAPALDLSVQPGLVTDPSVGALVENSFNPMGSQELKLQAATIETIGKVNDVLAGAGDSITDVRKSLNSSTETLGTKTVSDLERGVVQIAASMRSLDGTVNGLGDQISSTLKSTGSSSLAQLDQTVSSIDALLGDTSQPVGQGSVRGDGCDATVDTGRGGGSVYDSLVRVAGTLNGYSRASEACKVVLTTKLRNSLGPAQGLAQQCAPSTPTQPNPLADSVTCLLDRTRKDLPAKISQTLETSRGTVIGTLDATQPKDLLTQATSVGGSLDKTIVLIAALSNAAPGGQTVDLGPVEDALDDVKATRQNFVSAVGSVRARANDEIATLAGLRTSQQSMFNEICGLLEDPAAPGSGPLSADQVNSLTGYLTTTTCPEDPNVDPPTMANPTNDGAVAAWQLVLAQTNPDPQSSSPLGIALRTFDEQVAAAEDALTDARAAVADGGDGTIKTVLQGLFREFGGLRSSRDQVRTALATLDDNRADAEEAINGAFDQAKSSAAADVQSSTQDSITKVGRQSIEARQQVTRAFTQSQAGMQRAASEIVADGRRTINGQRGKLTQSSKKSSTQIQSNVRAGLDTIADTVSSSTRNTTAAGRLLRADLTKVLLDLGNPEVQGAGLLGTLGSNAGKARAADFQVARASSTASSYANARALDVNGIRLRQKQAEAAFQRLAQLPAFQVDVPQGVEHRTIYSYHLAAGQ